MSAVRHAVKVHRRWQPVVMGAGGEAPYNPPWCTHICISHSNLILLFMNLVLTAPLFDAVVSGRVAPQEQDLKTLLPECTWWVPGVAPVGCGL
mgnify:CR=1 FL=1